LKALTPHLVLAPDAAIDLQMHTAYGDGRWAPSQLIDYLVSERFGLVAITDHARPFFCWWIKPFVHCSTGTGTVKVYPLPGTVRIYRGLFASGSTF
jgi:hypothetical protein